MSFLVAVVGGIVAGLSALLTGFFLYRKEQKDKRRKLRLALLEELNQMYVLDEKKSSADIFPGLVISTKVFDNISLELGILTEAEVKKIVTFYDALHHLTETAKIVLKKNEPLETDEELINTLIGYRDNVKKILKDELNIEKQSEEDKDEKRLKREVARFVSVTEEVFKILSRFFRW